MAHQTASGATLAIALAAPSTYDTAGYSALTFEDIGEITNIGEFGKEWEQVTHQPLSTRGTKKGKGSFDNGDLNPAMALDPNDAGQIDMATSLEADSPARFRITLQDSTTFYFEALVMAFKRNVGGINDVVTASAKLAVTDSPIV